MQRKPSVVRRTIRILAYLFGAVGIVLMTLVGIPFAALFFVATSPFATIRWAFHDEETWLESWKEVAKGLG